MWKTHKVKLDLPWSMDMPERLGGDEADVMLHIRGEYFPLCRGSFERGGGQLEPDEPEHVEYDCIIATSEAMYGPVETINVTDAVYAWPRDVSDRFDEAVLNELGVYDEY